MSRAGAGKIDLLDDSRAVGQRAQESATVGLGHDAGVEDDDDTPVGPGPDQPAEALLELDHGLGNLVFHERVSASLADVFQAGLEQGMAGNAERQADDDHVGKGLAGDVDTLPEAVGAEDHAVQVGLERLDHLRPRQTIALGEEGDVPLGQPGSERAGRGVEHLVRREEHERLALGAFQVVGDRLDRDPLEILGLVRRVGEVPGQVNGHLVGIIKRASQRVSLGRGDAQTGLEEIELRRRAHAERRGGENAGGHLGEELLAQGRADVERGRRQADARSRSLLQLDPVDLIVGRLAESRS